MTDLAFSPEELQVIEHINAAMRGIQALGLRKDTSNLDVELAMHVHGLQMFVVKHALERIEFNGVSQGKWFCNHPPPEKGGGRPWIPRRSPR